MQNLRLFVEVAKLRSFSEAASRRGITQSAVSQRVRQLEAQLDAQLLDRSTRPWQLTPAGELLASEGRQVIDQYDDLCRRASLLEPRLEGTVTVDAIYSAGIGLLEQLRERFGGDAPRIDVQLEYKRPDEVADAVRSGGCDFGIISYPRRWRDVSVKPLRDERMSLVCAPTHPLATRHRPVHAKELSRHEMVSFGADLPVGRHIRSYLKQNGVAPRFANTLDNIDTMKSYLVARDHLAILPQRTVLREIQSGTLVALELRPTLERPMGIIRAKNGQLSPAAKAFADFLLSHAAAIEVEPEETTHRTLGAIA